MLKMLYVINRQNLREKNLQLFCFSSSIQHLVKLQALCACWKREVGKNLFSRTQNTYWWSTWMPPRKLSLGWWDGSTGQCTCSQSQMTNLWSSEPHWGEKRTKSLQILSSDRHTPADAHIQSMQTGVTLPTHTNNIYISWKTQIFTDVPSYENTYKICIYVHMCIFSTCIHLSTILPPSLLTSNKN